MPANEFEKHVQERLDDFQLNPSAAVWKNVEAQIRNKKKRRFVFFFLLHLIIGMGVAVTLLLNSSSRNEVETRLDSATIDKSKMSGETRVNENKDVQPNKQPLIENKSASSENEPAVPVAESPNNSLTVKSLSTREKNSNEEQVTFSNKKPPVKNHIQRDKTTTKNVLPIEEKESVPAAMMTKKPSASNAFDEKKAETNTIVTTDKDTTIEVNAILDSAETREIEKIAKPTVTSRKWQWGLEASFGVSSIRTNLLSVAVMSPSADYYQNAPGVGSGGPSSITPPSVIRPSNAFTIGGFANTRISGRINFSVGLRYSFTSTSIKTGIRKDSLIEFGNGSTGVTSANGYYDGAPIEKFTNRFHFIQVPISAQWKVSHHFPLYASLGMNLGYLVKTNGLIYNPSRGGIYYHDRKGFNRLHLGLSTGVSYGLKLKNSELQIGPVLSMDMTRMMKESFDTRGYLMYGGINIRYIFPEKKRQ